MTIYNVDLKDFNRALSVSIGDRETCAYFPDNDTKFAYVPISWNRQELFSQYGIIGYKLYYDAEEGGGVIIGGPDDLSFLIMTPFSNYDMSEYIISKLVEYLSTKFDNVSVDGNDILISNNKVIGTAGAIVNDMSIFMFMATFEDNTTIINELCPPRHGKIPTHIDTSILTKQELKEKIVEWLQ